MSAGSGSGALGSDSLRAVFSPEAAVLFVFATILLAVIANAVFALLTQWLGNTPKTLATIIGTGLVILAFVVYVLAWITDRQLRVEVDLKGMARPRKRRGLILLVSRLEPCKAAIEYHRPRLERIWLVHTEQTRPIADQLTTQYSNLEPKPVLVDNINDPLKFSRKISGIYHGLEAGWRSNDVIVDYLGMTANASVGAVLACIGHDRPVQYTLPVFDKDRHPIGVDEPVEIKLPAIRRKKRRSDNDSIAPEGREPAPGGSL